MKINDIWIINSIKWLKLTRSVRLLFSETSNFVRTGADASASTRNITFY